MYFYRLSPLSKEYHRALCIIKLDFLFWLMLRRLVLANKFKMVAFAWCFHSRSLMELCCFLHHTILKKFASKASKGHLCFFHQHVTQNETVEWNPYHDDVVKMWSIPNPTNFGLPFCALLKVYPFSAEYGFRPDAVHYYKLEVRTCI